MILYINGNYPHHSLHSELVAKLADMGNDITVFVPMNGTQYAGKYRCEHPKVRVFYCDCQNAFDRIFFMRKIHKIVQNIIKSTDMTKVDCILAGTLYSDGAAAYLLHKKYHIPYSIAVRQTDVTFHMKWRPYLNGFMKNVLTDAKKIIFLSPAYQKHIDKFGCNHEKYEIIPNAVNDYWFQNQRTSRELHDPLSLIYVGEITKLKNVTVTISTLAELNRKHIPAVFHIVGSGNEENTCQELAEKLGVADYVFFHGWQNNKETIRAFYDQADAFVMPSLRETFGTVYIEALSQGLPVIYSHGQGIDGYFKQGRIGYACNPHNVNEITAAITSILQDYTSISTECIKLSRQFQWNVVAEQYNNLINDMRGK